VTTGAAISRMTFPGGGSATLGLDDAGGAGEEDANGGLGESPALEASGFGSATTGDMLSGFGSTVCHAPPRVLDLRGFAGPG
jgi:hypothetical protein